jgi:hypothetical protein
VDVLIVASHPDQNAFCYHPLDLYEMDEPYPVPFQSLLALRVQDAPQLADSIARHDLGFVQVHPCNADVQNNRRALVLRDDP